MCVLFKTFLINQTNKKTIYCVVLGCLVWREEWKGRTLYGQDEVEMMRKKISHTIFIYIESLSVSLVLSTFQPFSFLFFCDFCVCFFIFCYIYMIGLEAAELTIFGYIKHGQIMSFGGVKEYDCKLKVFLSRMFFFVNIWSEASEAKWSI